MKPDKNLDNEDTAVMEREDEHAVDTNDVNNTGADDASNDDYSDEELAAIEQGWRPDYDGPDARSAKEFLERGSFFKKIDSLKGALEKESKSSLELKEQVAFLLERTRQAEKLAYEKAINDLKQQKIDALEDNDHRTAVEIDDKIADMKSKKDSIDDEIPVVKDKKDVPAQPTPEFQSFVSNNDWYVNNKVLQAEADTIGLSYREDYPNSSLEEVFNHVSKTIKKEFPEYFANKQRKSPPAVEAGGTGSARRSGRKKSYTVQDMDPSDVTIMRNMIATGSIKTEEEYISKLEKTGYFKNI